MKSLNGSLIILLGLAIGGLPLPDVASSQSSSGNAFQIVAAGSVPADSTEKNVRDQDDATLTPLDQSSGSEEDVEMTRRIREAIMADETLSTNAQNIKIVTLNGMTTLRGPVENAAERARILNKASKVAGEHNVRNELEVTTP
jgi:hyperosmotically inducible periplasmic protein